MFTREQIDAVTPRDQEYNDKHSPQELAICNILARFVTPDSVVVDLGCGNGELAHKITTLLRVKVIGVDNNEYRLIHSAPTFDKFLCDMSDHAALDKKFGGMKIIAVCKHLCGEALDAAMDYFLGKCTHFVFEMCCLHKCSHERLGMTPEEIKNVGWVSINDPTNPKIKTGKILMNKIIQLRRKRMVEAGYNVELEEIEAKTPYNIIAVGTRV